MDAYAAMFTLWETILVMRLQQNTEIMRQEYI